MFKTIPKYIDYYDESIIDEIFTLKLPMNVCTKEIYKDIIEIIFECSIDDETEREYVQMLRAEAFKFASKKKEKRNETKRKNININQ